MPPLICLSQRYGDAVTTSRELRTRLLAQAWAEDPWIDDGKAFDTTPLASGWIGAEGTTQAD